MEKKNYSGTEYDKAREQVDLKQAEHISWDDLISMKFLEDQNQTIEDWNRQARSFVPGWINLSKEDWQAIIDATRRILSSSIEAGGTTIRSFSYGKNHAGSYQDSLMVHGKEGSCARCDTPIVHTRVGQRSTWYCPSCQKEK